MENTTRYAPAVEFCQARKQVVSGFGLTVCERLKENGGELFSLQWLVCGDNYR
jgi:hypothetical protein